MHYQNPAFSNDKSAKCRQPVTQNPTAAGVH